MATIDYNLDPLGSAVAVSFAGSGDLRISDAAWNNEPGSGDWLWVGWVKIDNKSTGRNIVFKRETVGNQRCYDFKYSSVQDKFNLEVSADGATSPAKAHVAAGSPTLGVWYFVEAGRIGSTISINATPASSGTRNTPETAAFAGNTFNSSAQLVVGANVTSGTRSDGMNGQIGQMYYWQGTLPTNTVLNAMFNSGAGLSKRAYIAGGYLTPTAAYELEEATGARVDWVAGKNLTPNGTVTYAAGHPFDIDFTSSQVAAAYTAANKISTDAWDINAYGDGDISGGGNVTFSGIATTSTGPFRLKKASGHAPYTDGTIAAPQSYVEVSGIDCLGLTASSLSGNISGVKFHQNIVGESGIQIGGVDGTYDAFEIINNEIFANALVTGILVNMYPNSAPAAFTNCKIQNNYVRGAAAAYGIRLMYTGAFNATLSGDMSNNIAIGPATCYDVASGWFSDTHTQHQNIAGDTTGEIDSETTSSVFTDYAGGDFTPLISGPAYRTGYANGVTVDRLGNARHSPMDIGPYENMTVVAGTPASLLLMGVG